MDNPKELRPKKPLSLSSKTLEIKKSLTDVHQVRQNFSHGRSKTVVVEVKKKRLTATVPQTPPAAPSPAETQTTPTMPPAAPSSPQAAQQGRLTNSEWEARVRAVQTMREGGDLSQERQEWEEEWRRQRDAAAQQHGAASPSEDSQDHQAQQGEQAQTPGESSSRGALHAPSGGRMGEEARPGFHDDESSKKRVPYKVEAKKPSSHVKRELAHQKTGKVNIRQVLDDSMEVIEKTRSLAVLRRAREKERLKHKVAHQEPQKVLRDVIIPETLTVQELANRMAERGADVIKALMKMGMMATINQVIDADTAELVVGEFGHRPQRVSESDIELGLNDQTDRSEDMQSRPPVVTIMGHVDHGKTSLLDAIRKTDVVSSEAGGITQHIGAYQIKTPQGRLITFIDTPGHAAFTEMRSRGAHVTDVVVLVVASDDGVKEQTVEAIRHAQAAKVPLVVAINKMDKPDAQPDRVRSELVQYEVVDEQYGGEVMSVEVSARTGMNLDKLEDAILLQADMLHLQANPHRSAVGTVIEARVDKGRGAVSTILVQKGTLRVGDIFVSGCQWGKVRALYDHHGHQVKDVLPSVPVEVIGFDAPPQAGDDFVVVESDAKARQVAEYRTRRLREHKLAASLKKRADQQGFDALGSAQPQEVSVLIKADVQGSAEALAASLAKLSTPEVAVRVLHTAVGPINESDVLLAKASQAMILGFNVRAHPQARDLARKETIEISYYSIIYNAIEDVKAKMSGVLAPTIKENILGYAQVRQIFNITKVGKIAGCMVTEGLMKRGGKVRLLRDGVVIHEGALKTLKRFKEEVKEVRTGYDCGMAFESYQDLQEGDQIECFELESIARTL